MLNSSHELCFGFDNYVVKFSVFNIKRHVFCLRPALLQYGKDLLSTCICLVMLYTQVFMNSYYNTVKKETYSTSFCYEL